MGFQSGWPVILAKEIFCKSSMIKISDVKESKETNLNDLSSLGESKCCIGGVDFVTLIFTLSAVPLHRMPTAIRECFSILKPGGLLLFRDYGLYDMTMLRFEPEKRVGFREYMRSDGTRSYFFCMDTVRDLFTGSGFTEVLILLIEICHYCLLMLIHQLELEYCCVKSNRRNGKSMHRVWVHGKFQKPF
ncbi:O-methyltransferase 3 [Vitis vinifera]|uniref:O-methyltransferase 3 n=1 Tax=Vitis vinifera TaxID=29760 RepID=A0A438DFG2_VITVI|nr:O-methyltransferase 3 [Vitis vinifera]